MHFLAHQIRSSRHALIRHVKTADLLTAPWFFLARRLHPMSLSVGIVSGRGLASIPSCLSDNVTTRLERWCSKRSDSPWSIHQTLRGRVWSRMRIGRCPSFKFIIASAQIARFTVSVPSPEFSHGIAAYCTRHDFSVALSSLPVPCAIIITVCENLAEGPNPIVGFVLGQIVRVARPLAAALAVLLYQDGSGPMLRISRVPEKNAPIGGLGF